MTDKPIIFSAPMIRALLDGRKTQTRRVLKPQPNADRIFWVHDGEHWLWANNDGDSGSANVQFAPSDRLWVREAWSGDHEFRDTPPAQRVNWAWEGVPHLRESIWYWADGAPEFGDWEKPRPSIHMPRWASRLTLIVTDVRVQRLLEISAQDAESEGVFRHVAEHSLNKVFRSERGTVAVEYFRDLWNSLHGPDAWDANPWVVALTFTVHRGNIDQMGVPA